MPELTDLLELIPDAATLQSASQIELSSGTEEDKRRPFAITAYTGAVFDIGFGDAVIDLAGLEASKDMPIFRQHDPTLFIGRSEEISLGDEVKVRGRLFHGVEAADEVASLSDQGAKWQASIGIGIDVSRVEFLADGETAQLNSREFKGPLLILRKVKVKETSFVPLGADGQTSAVVLSDLQRKGVGMPGTVDPLKQERERVAALSKEFADDPGFAIEAVTSGLSLLEAKAKFGEKLQAKLKVQATEAEAALAAQAETSKAKIAELEAKLAKAAKPNPAALLTLDAGVPAGSDPSTTWETALAAEIKRLNDAGSKGLNAGFRISRGCNVRAQAVANVTKKNPQLQEAYLASLNPGKDLNSLQTFAGRN